LFPRRFFTVLGRNSRFLKRGRIPASIRHYALELCNQPPQRVSMLRFRFLAAVLVSLLALASSGASAASPENTLYLDLKDGRVVIELRPDLAPEHVRRVKQLVKEGFYDGLTFHRVINGFMAQTGDPKGDGTGGSKYPNLPAEFSQDPFARGTIGAARSSDPNSANSQFFICFEAASHLDGKYTVWGQVIEGMQFVDAIKKGLAANGEVVNPDKIIKMQLAAGAR
jgi:peptidylprolyl isomerase